MGLFTKIVVGVGALAVVGALLPDGESGAEAQAARAQMRSMMPPEQVRFVDAIEAARQQYQQGANEMAKGAARPARARAICSAMAGTNVSGWVGRVDTLSTNGDGKGVLRIEIAPRATIGTWNNSLSDIGNRTLIEPNSPLFSLATSLKKGQLVRVDGILFRDDTDCVRESSMSLDGSIRDPAYIVRFGRVQAI